MAPRTAAAATEVEESHSMPGLQFNQPLSWRAGKPIAVADLLRRLQALSKEMQGMDQEQNERESFTKVAKELVNPNLLTHKDKGVKALTACCLVDILRICAPDAPFTGQQLKDIFNLIITQILPALADPSHAYNHQHIYVLNSLAVVKSIILLADLPIADTLITNVFKICFDVLASPAKVSDGEGLQRTVESDMTAMLVCLVDETPALPSDAVDIIVAQFLRTDPKAVSGSGGKNKKNGIVDEKQSTLVLRQLPPAYNMAKYICIACPENMARYFSQYFNDIVIDASQTSTHKVPSKNKKRHSDGVDDSDDDHTGGPNEEGISDLRKVHGLLRELWRACPGVLQNVIPQLEAELSAENIQLRLLATETFGDIISGIGAAGPPAPANLDPAAYPSNALADPSENTTSLNLVTKPSSPQPFPSTHPQAYANYLGRRLDKSALVRAAWTTGIGRILTTSAGGAGLSQQEEDRLIADLGRTLGDSDEKVRIAAVRLISNFSFRDIVHKLGRSGGVDESGSVLATLAERVKDLKQPVRAEAMPVLARIWGVAVGEISAGNEQVCAMLKGIPSKILNTHYTNDLEVMALLDHIFFEQLLPLNYPPVKAKNPKMTNGSSQGAKENQGETIDPDKIRTERILLLIRDLDGRAKKVFYINQSRPPKLAPYVTAFLELCEEYNGGVMDQNEAQIKEHLTKLIQTFAGRFVNSQQASADLWKFAKMHDRRSYQLIRFCMKPDTDYRTIIKAIRELTKRIVEISPSTTASNSLVETLTSLLYQISLIVYNKSHVPAIMEYTRTDDKSLAATAHELLRQISSQTPEVLKAHVQAICKTLQDEAPTAKKANDAGAVDNLKACASFASKYPKEIPQDPKFRQAMTSFALHGSPAEAAKYAVSVIWAASEKKEMLVRDLVQQCLKGFQYGGEGFLSRLATLSQLMLLAPNEIGQDSTDAILDVAIKQILTQVREPSKKAADAYEWSSSIDTEALAKIWALKILVNHIRSHDDAESLPAVAAPQYRLLSNLIEQQGELSSARDTPPSHKSRLRLLAARLYLKLCTHKPHEALLTASAFNALAVVAQDSIREVRAGFLQRLKKYLHQQKLSQRFYTIPFLFAFEPSDQIRSDVTTWIKSRAAIFSNIRSQQMGSSSKVNTVMESVIARLISLLAHHPDYASDAEDLIDLSRYIIFYLQNVATEDNLSLIYHIAQRVKACRDAVTSTPAPDAPPTEADDRLYHLSDLAQITIRKYEDTHNWTIQTLPGKVRLPSSLFSEIKSHSEAQRIAEHNYLPEDVEAGVEHLLKATLRASRPGHGKKRKSEGDSEGREAKKAKALPVRKAAGTGATKEKKATPKKTAMKTKTPTKAKKTTEPKEPDSGERRRSGRAKTVEKNYVERDSEEDDEEMYMNAAAEEPETNSEVDALADDSDPEMDDRNEEVRTNRGPDEAEGEEESDQEEEPEVEVEEEEPEEESAPKTTPIPASRSKRKTTTSPQSKTKARPTKPKPKATRSKASSNRARPKQMPSDDDDELSDPPESE
ncbi:MAG: hypothetical protein L6R38_000312 [Xanthoria sp. 2 TBL-2021]|nr:MAG: hypothetical protein L6R38_000312 [Xanthoria sp. 2 TBL-2021]